LFFSVISSKKLKEHARETVKTIAWSTVRGVCSTANELKRRSLQGGTVETIDWSTVKNTKFHLYKVSGWHVLLTL
jgi:hypothetical protein